ITPQFSENITMKNHVKILVAIFVTLLIVGSVNGQSVSVYRATQKPRNDGGETSAPANDKKLPDHRNGGQLQFSDGESVIVAWSMNTTQADAVAYIEVLDQENSWGFGLSTGRDPVTGNLAWTARYISG